MNYLTVMDKLPHQYYLIIETKAQEIQINCMNIENFSIQEDGRITLIYFIPLTDWQGRPKAEMERRIEEYECFESALLLKTYQGIR